MRKSIFKTITSVMLLLVFMCPAASAKGGLAGQALETTQWLNKALLEAIKDTGLEEVYKTTQLVTTQTQMFAKQIQQFAEAVKTNLSAPFAIANDLKNTGTSIYNTMRGTGEGLFSYATATDWYSSMRNSSGALSFEKDNKAAYTTMNDIITKDESEASLAKDIEDMSNSAEGPTKAVQANTLAQMAQLAAQKNSNAADATFYAWFVKREAQKEVFEAQDKDEMEKEVQRMKAHSFE